MIGEILSIISNFICLIIATFGAFFVSAMLKEIKDNQKLILNSLDNIELLIEEIEEQGDKNVVF